jgi:hypothetical protein
MLTFVCLRVLVVLGFRLKLRRKITAARNQKSPMSRFGVFKQSLRLFAVQSISETTKKAKKHQKCKKNSPDREIESS